ncbi:unnamed protein product [Caenorhabditis angaria]|uniref:Uncharacterized protein n=1 Tax=Caenorhabditis angaria TaxID=860376 RepID=A0A9P1IMS6_9PELO|nr:unnamed protein product [Caenorhabditis angaria]
MIKKVIFSLICLQVFAAPDFENLAEFKKFVKDFDRKYQNEAEFQKRFEIFSANLNLIRRYNQEDFEKGISYSINDFADLTEEEYQQNYLMNPTKKENSKKNIVDSFGGVIPNSIDWRNVNNQNHVSSVKYQGKCGSCWAFAVAQSIESAVSIASGTTNPESLSSQQILDCTPNSGKCQGGEPLDAIEYVIEHGGLTTAKSYPYLFFSTKCREDNKQIVANISTYLLGSTEDHIAQLVGSKGPVVVCANFATNKNRFYHGGIAEDPECGTEPTHALIVVGYTPDYWILKNTYSTIWGEKGYMRVKRGVNWCGLTTENSILPIV